MSDPVSDALAGVTTAGAADAPTGAEAGGRGAGWALADSQPGPRLALAPGRRVPVAGIGTAAAPEVAGLAGWMIAPVTGPGQDQEAEAVARAGPASEAAVPPVPDEAGRLGGTAACATPSTAYITSWRIESRIARTLPP